MPMSISVLPRVGWLGGWGFYNKSRDAESNFMSWMCCLCLCQAWFWVLQLNVTKEKSCTKHWMTPLESQTLLSTASHSAFDLMRGEMFVFARSDWNACSHKKGGGVQKKTTDPSQSYCTVCSESLNKAMCCLIMQVTGAWTSLHAALDLIFCSISATHNTHALF